MAWQGQETDAVELLMAAEMVETPEQRPYRIRSALLVAQQVAKVESIELLAFELLRATGGGEPASEAENMQVLVDVCGQLGNATLVRSAVEQLAEMGEIPRAPLAQYWPLLLESTRGLVLRVFASIHDECMTHRPSCMCRVPGTVEHGLWALASGPALPNTGRQRTHSGPTRHPVVVLSEYDDSVNDHLWALSNQLQAAGVSVINIERLPDNGARIVFEGEAREFSDSDKFSDWLRRVGASHAAFVRPYMGFPRSEIDKSLDRLPRIQLNYHPFLAGGDYFFNSDFGEFVFPGFLAASLVCAQNSWTKQAFLNLGLSPQRVLQAGDPLMWEMARRPIQDNLPKYDLLWSPHWSVTGVTRFSNGYGNLGADVQFVARLADHGLRILIRAHPLTFMVGRSQTADSLRHSPESHSFLHHLLALTEHPNITISSGSIIEDLEASQVVVTDGVSMIAYSALLSRPLIVRRRPDAAGFRSEWSHLTDFLTIADSLENLGSLTSHAVDPNLILRLRNATVELAEVGKFRSSPGELIAQTLIE